MDPDSDLGGSKHMDPTNPDSDLNPQHWYNVKFPENSGHRLINIARQKCHERRCLILTVHAEHAHLHRGWKWNACNSRWALPLSTSVTNWWLNRFKGGFFRIFHYFIQFCFICRSSDSTVSKDAGIEPRTVTTVALAVRRFNHSARSHSRRLHKTWLLYYRCWRSWTRCARTAAWPLRRWRRSPPGSSGTHSTSLTSFSCLVRREELKGQCHEMDNCFWRS